jgi:segregation and condensation protein B
MDYFGINSADDLPKIREVLAEQMIEPTVVNHTEFEQSEVLAVSDDGELIGAEQVADLPTESPSEHVNGHAFEIVIEDEESEDPQTEEAVEEFISDAEFVIGDQEEELREIKEEELFGNMDEMDSDEEQRDQPQGDEDNGV